jgi:hypothetical protein
MTPNVDLKQYYPVKGQVNPASIAAGGNAVSAWLDAKDGNRLHIALLAGALGGGTLDVDVDQATDNAGTGSKVLAADVLAAQATNNTPAQADVDLHNLLDVNGGYRFVRVKINNTGGTGAIAGAACLIGPARFQS